MALGQPSYLIDHHDVSIGAAPVRDVFVLVPRLLSSKPQGPDGWVYRREGITAHALRCIPTFNQPAIAYLETTTATPLCHRVDGDSDLMESGQC